MAGSYKHVVKDDGNLRNNENVVESLETGGDVFEAVEEMYGMIWFLASELAIFDGHSLAESADSRRIENVKRWVETARQNYKGGLEVAKEVNAR